MSEGNERLIAVGRDKIPKQNELPLSKAIEISFKSLKVRFWRSIITMSGIILAIAFLMWIWTDAAVIRPLLNSDDSTVQILLRTMGYQVKDVSLAAAGSGAEAAADGLADAEAKNTWLVTLSLLVAAVGIINAMLMSVTERFREIGTMKCLGALNSFIVKLFLLESAFQGTLGTLIGIVIGLSLNLIWNWINFGTTIFFDHIGQSLGDLGTSTLWALVIGIGLSVAGAIYPALVAAHMEPVVAMRVDA